MSATVYNPAPFPLYDTNGSLATGAKAYFYLANTTTPLAVYEDSGLTTAHDWPVVANAAGFMPPIFLPYVDYRVKIKNSSDALIFDADGIANPEPTDDSSSTASSQLLQTGDVLWRMSSGARDGFVRMNGLTLGSASSGATERANADSETLYGYLWSNFSDSIAPVSGGRGATAAADWAANKPIVIPSMQGRAPIGLDDMGGSASNIVQVSTTASVTNGSANITVASAAGLGRGMNVLIDGVASGTILSISGTTVTLSGVYTGATGSGKAVRASYFSNAQTGGVAGGSQSFSQTSAELATHTHVPNDPGHSHQYPVGAFVSSTGASVGDLSVGNNATASATTGITNQNAGSGLPAPLIQPSRLGTWYIKL